MRISDWSSDVCSSDLQRRAGALVDHHYVRRRADLPAVAVVEVAQRLLVHEVDRVAEGLDARLQTEGGGRRAVVLTDGVVLEQRAFTVLAADDEAALHDLGEHQAGGGLLRQLCGSRGILLQQRQGIARSVATTP